MKIVITKADVIKAIRTEPLKEGCFFGKEEADVYGNNKHCQVCAVGAILDQKMGKSSYWRFSDSLNVFAQRIVAYWSSDVRTYRTALNEKKYLSALSIYFEDIMQRDNSKQISGLANNHARGLLIRFVNKHFPRAFVLDTLADDKSY